MFYVYILRLSNHCLYTGSTNDLKRRMKEHQSGKSEFTSKFLPLELIHYEAYKKESDARRREKYLKTSEGKKALKKQLRDLLKEYEILDLTLTESPG